MLTHLHLKWTHHKLLSCVQMLRRVTPIDIITKKHTEPFRPHQPGCLNRCCLQHSSTLVGDTESHSACHLVGAWHPLVGGGCSFTHHSFNLQLHWNKGAEHVIYPCHLSQHQHLFNPLGYYCGSGIFLQWLAWTQVARPLTLTFVWIVSSTWSFNTWTWIVSYTNWTRIAKFGEVHLVSVLREVFQQCFCAGLLRRRTDH